jgi:choice-of-anchor A domain-containing protein
MSCFTSTRSLRQCASLPLANIYNLLVLTNVEQRNNDIEGRAAIGGNAVFSSFGIGSSLCDPPNSPCPIYGTDPTLVVGGNLTWQNGANFSGNTIMTPSGSYNVTGVSYNNANAAIQPIRTANLPVGFSLLFDYFRCASLQWIDFTSLPNTTTIINCFGNVFFIGLNEDINIFNIDVANVAPPDNVVGGGNNTFDTISSITIIAPNNSTILVNVNGEIVNFGNYSISRSTMVPDMLPSPSTSTCNQLGQGEVPTDSQKRLILWNFYNATTIVTSNISFQGTVFAPLATIYTLGGNIEGNVIAYAYLPFVNNTNHTEIHNYLFNGCLPVVNCFPSTTSSSTTSTSTTSTTTSSTSTTSTTTSTTTTTSTSTTTTSTTSSTSTSSTTTYPPHCCPCCPCCGCKMVIKKLFLKVFCLCPHCGYTTNYK